MQKQCWLLKRFGFFVLTLQACVIQAYANSPHPIPGVSAPYTNTPSAPYTNPSQVSNGPESTQPSLSQPILPQPNPQIVKQTFKTFTTIQPAVKPNKPTSPPNLPPLQSLINTPPSMPAQEHDVQIYGVICNGVICKAMTNYGLISAGQKIFTHTYVANVNPYSVSLKRIIKVGKKERTEYKTIGLFGDNTNH